MKLCEYFVLGHKADNVLLEISNFQNGSTTDVEKLLEDAKDVILEFYELVSKVISEKNVEDVLKQ